MKTTDTTYQMVLDIYNTPVPLQSELTNPFKPKSKPKKSSLLPKTAIEVDVDYTNWSSRDFVDYFAIEYKKMFGGIYKKTYSSDCSHINEIIEFMDANELDKNEWSKKFIDWCFVNKEYISSQSGTFLLSSVKKQLNTFYQQVISENKKSKPVIDIFDELVEMIDKGKTKEVLAIYGIPIVSTYVHYYKNVSDENIKAGLRKLFISLIDGDADTQKLLTKIVQRSINRSPYPDLFILTDWRNEYPELAELFKNELWWKDKDYIGSYQYKYDRFLTNG
jgi:hypothetical protein